MRVLSYLIGVSAGCGLISGIACGDALGIGISILNIVLWGVLNYQAD